MEINPRRRVFKNSLLQKLLGEWVQAFGAKMSGIVWVDGIQGNHQPIISNAGPPKRSQNSLRRKLIPNLPIVSGVGNKGNLGQFRVASSETS